MPTGFAPRSFAERLADRVDPPQHYSGTDPQYLPDYPESDKQEIFVAFDGEEGFYGGAAGGGKSDALLRSALKYVHVPQYSALLLRRSYPELTMPGGLLSRSRLWLANSDAKWSGAGGEESYTWKFPSGARMVFGHGKTLDELLRYYGSEWQFIGWDELTHFTEEQYTLLFSRLRRPATGPLSVVPLRMRGASNPGNKGHEWVKRRLIEKKPRPIDPPDPLETPEKCAARVFIPAFIDDNPGLDKQGYRNSLSNLDVDLRAQLEDGDWNVREPGDWVFDAKAIAAAIELGAIFDGWRKAGKLAPPVDSNMATGVDYGDFATVQEIIYPLERGGIYVPPGEVATSREDPEEIAKQFVAALKPYTEAPGVWWYEHRYDSSFAQTNRTFTSQAEKKLGRHNPRRRSGRPNTYPVAFGTYKDLCIRYVRLLLNRTLAAKEADWAPAKLTRVIAISPTNELLCAQLPRYEEGEDGKPVKGNDDAIDALLAGSARSARAHRKVIEEGMAKARKHSTAEAFSKAGR